MGSRSVAVLSRAFILLPFLLLIGAWSPGAAAAMVTIDFESLPDQTGQVCGPVCTTDPARWIDNGFLIEGSDDVANGSFPGGVVDPGLGFGVPPARFGQRSLFFCGTCGPLEFVLTQQNGQAFDLLSFDLTAAFPGGGDQWTVIGALARGGEVTALFRTGRDITVSFNSDWVGLESVTILAAAENALNYQLDNIVVTAVPIPAAVWLFGSALAALGWLRRQRVA